MARSESPLQTQTKTVRMPKVIIEAWKSSGLEFPEFLMGLARADPLNVDVDRLTVSVLKAQLTEKREEVKQLTDRISTLEARLRLAEESNSVEAIIEKGRKALEAESDD